MSGRGARSKRKAPSDDDRSDADYFSGEEEPEDDDDVIDDDEEDDDKERRRRPPAKRPQAHPKTSARKPSAAAPPSLARAPPVEGARRRSVPTPRAAAAAAGAAAEEEEEGGGDGGGGGSMPPPRGRPRLGRGGGARRASSGALAAAAGGGGGGGAAGSGGGGDGRHVERIQLARGDISRMNAKIAAYQEAASEAESKLATLLSNTENVALVASVVRLMLFKQHEKPGVPVKRAELGDACFVHYKKHAHSKKLPALVIKVAQARCAAVLGLEMAEVLREAAATKKRGAGHDDAPSTTQTYVLRSILPPEIRRQLVDDPADQQATGLKMTVLALIHLNGGQMEPEELWRHLGMLGLAPGDKDHPFFPAGGDKGDKGGGERALEELEKQRHVVRSCESGAAGAVEVLRWGENASSEVGEEGIKRFIEERFSEAPGFRDTAGGSAGGGGASGSGAGGG